MTLLTTPSEWPDAFERTRWLMKGSSWSFCRMSASWMFMNISLNPFCEQRDYRAMLGAWEEM